MEKISIQGGHALIWAKKRIRVYSIPSWSFKVIGRLMAKFKEEIKIHIYHERRIPGMAEDGKGAWASAVGNSAHVMTLHP